MESDTRPIPSKPNILQKENIMPVVLAVVLCVCASFLVSLFIVWLKYG